MELKEIVERIMSQHWDIVACKCWICTEGRKNGCGAKGDYLPHNSKIEVERVDVEEAKDWSQYEIGAKPK